MRVVVVDTYYPAFLAAHYAARPGLEARPYGEQLRTLMERQFGTSDAYSHELRGHGHEAHDLVVNALELQARWADEQGRARLIGRLTALPGRPGALARYRFLHQVARAQIDALDPEVVYVQDLWFFTRGELDRLRRQGRLVAGQIASQPPGPEVLRGFDLITTSFPHYVERFRALGVDSEYFPIAFDERVIERLQARGVDPDASSGGRDVAVASSAVSTRRVHPGGVALVERLAPTAAAGGVGLRRRRAAGRLPARAALPRRGLGARHVRDARPHPHLAQPAHRGRRGLRQQHAPVREHRRRGACSSPRRRPTCTSSSSRAQEVVTYGSEDELVARVEHLLAHEDEQRAIAAAGQARTLRDHTYRRRIGELADMLRGTLASLTMHREFCTLFDSNYLIKAVVLYRSLERHAPSFHLTAFCFDDEAKRVLDELAFPHLSTVSLGELEAFDRELLSVKDDRTPVEYCWTATPALPLYVLGTRPELNEITYLDADLMFFADPEALFEEMGDASVLITPHRYASEYAHQAINGIYNVQFLPFRRDERGLQVLRWWHERCIEWCYYRLEDGKLGDQKYLDDWPERFAGVHVLQHKGGGLAPWNITQYDVRETPQGVEVDGEPLVFFHYHRVKLLTSGGYDWHPPGYFISDEERRLVYDPYLAELGEATAVVRGVEPGWEAGMVPPPPLRERLRDARIRLAARLVAVAPVLARVRR